MDMQSNTIKNYKNQMGIYLLTIGKHTYVGSSISLYSRLSQHKTKLKTNKHHNKFMISCWNKYKYCDIEILELCIIDQKELLIREKEWIDILNPDLNLEPDPTTQRECVTTSKIVYQYDIGGKFIQEHRGTSTAERFLNKASSKVSQCCLGKRKSAYGYLWSYDKIVDKLVYENNSSKAKAKKVSQYSTAGEFIKTYKSVAEAVRALNKPENASTNISSAALGNTKHAYNYVWKYE